MLILKDYDVIPSILFAFMCFILCRNISKILINYGNLILLKYLKILLNTGLKMISLVYQNNYIHKNLNRDE